VRHIKVVSLMVSVLAFQGFTRAVHNGKTVRQLPMQADERACLGKASTGAFPHYWPHPAGIRPLLALLVDFTDAPADFSKADVDSMLNSPGYKRFGNNGSVRDYFLDVSRGILDVRFQVKGYYRAKKTKAYYETRGDNEGAHELLEEVVRAYDLSVDYSALGTPEEIAINSIAFLYAGAEHAGSDLWGATTDNDSRVDGKRVGRAFWAAIGKSELEIGTASHEMGHMLFNWPDLYNVPDGGGGLKAHCLMADFADYNNPIPPNEAFLADQNWVEAQDLAATRAGRYFAPANHDKVFRFMNPDRATESFFVVNRKNTGRYASLDGRGILIFHFDMAWNRNDDEYKAAVLLVDDKGKTDSPSDGPEPAWYFYKNKMSEFSRSAQGAGNDWHDGTASGIRIHSIGALADTMEFKTGDVSVTLGPTSLGPTPPSFRNGPGTAAGYDLRGRNLGKAPLTRHPGRPAGFGIEQRIFKEE
jgi:M6 family metalloprotease-like protein